ncbi:MULTISPECIES: hypothetical protein [unclassified Microbacterium]|uniref:hypothetical protein n=1 Tax=unclassified Microbacterium TaxID=2609290 RepID=UPI0012F90728|nr:hypothetical protein [Microbacterium sp. MAH-37]MVQ42923.1 hypothetical protein [Microbacterium sp. MAH-37]
MHPALVYLPGDRLSLTELGAARLDGHVVEVGEGFLPADTVEGPEARALSLCALIPSSGALCGPSAAWVHGAGDLPPARHHVCRADAAAARLRPGPRIVTHQVALTPDQTVRIAGVPVAAVDAVAISLAFTAGRDPESAHWLRALIEVFPGLAARTYETIGGRSRAPGKRPALELLARLVDQEVVTR